jgi:O-antigen ligase
LYEVYLIQIYAALGIIFATLLFDKKLRRKLSNPGNWPLWLFVATMGFGLVNPLNPKLALSTYFTQAIPMVLLFFVGEYLYSDTNMRKSINLVMCGCGIVVAIIGFLELFFKKNIIYVCLMENYFYERYIGSRPMSTQMNPVVLGTYFLGCLPFMIELIKEKSLSVRVLGIISSLFAAVTVILTFSRQVLLGFIAWLIAFLYLKGKRKLIIFLIFICIIFVTVCTFSGNYNINRFGFKRLVAGSYDSIISEYRFNRINMTCKILKVYPLSGIGLNHFRLRFKEYCPHNEGNAIHEFMIPDNMYLSVLAETGIIGMSGFLIFMLWIFCAGLKNKSIAPLGAFVGMSVNMAAYELFFWQGMLMFFFLICGFIKGTEITDG